MRNSASESSKQWADTPFPLIETPKYKERKTANTNPYLETASQMCVVHNVLQRGLNSIYIQGPNIQPSDYKDFIGYSLCWHAVVHDHHTSEEDLFFPDIEEAVGVRGLMEGNVQQHLSFQTGLDAFKTYLESLTGNEKSFDASHLNEIINTFEPALHSHLQTEIQDLLALEKYGDNLPIKKLWDKEGKHAVTSMTKFNGLPFFFLNLDITFEEGLYKDWPPIPGVARWVVMNCFTVWNQGFWKFASCDIGGRPRELYAPGGDSGES